MIHLKEIFPFLDQILDMNLLYLNPFVLGQEIVLESGYKTFCIPTQTDIH